MRYFFDFCQGDDVTPDDDGSVFPTEDLMKQEATRLLKQIIHLMSLAGGDVSGVSVNVRDENGAHVYEAQQGSQPRPN